MLAVLCMYENLNSLDVVDVFHFDFQQNLPTPKLSVGKKFYLRLPWTYLIWNLFCIYQDI